jgi:hypothetical protein
MKTQMQWWSRALLVAAVTLMLRSPLTVKAQGAQVAPDAQPQQGAQSDDNQDPPGRVARLNYIDGSVSFQPGGENDWLDAVVNRPLITGDNLWADQDSRAEVHIGSTALRLASMTGITLLEVSDRVAQIRLVQGSLIVKVRHVDDEDSYEIDTPNVAFVVMQPGDYRIDVDAEGARTDVMVWRGRGEVTGGGSSYTVVANQHASFTGTDQLNSDLAQTSGNDQFDSWAMDRDRTEDESDSANYVSRETTGYEDLDEYGDWNYVAGYGPCWRPRVLAAGWAPYRFGHWIWVSPWGWTWVEDEPWGFAPFHYGRWAYVGANWLWVPGPAVVRPIYAPALVAWVGGAPGVAFSFGAGVGWFPLAPGEVFIPGYRASRAYVNTVNLTNTHVEMTKITSIYNSVAINRSAGLNNLTFANRGVAGGVTVVSRDTFLSAQPVARNAVSVPEKELVAAPVSHIAALEPVRTSVIGAGKLASNKPPMAMMTRQVVALRTPAPMPSSFEQRKEQAGGHLNQPQLVHQQAPGRPVPTSVQSRQAQTEDGFRPFAQPAEGTNQAKPQPRYWEAQGTPEPEKPAQSAQPNSRSLAASRSLAPSQQSAQWSHPLAKPVAPVQEKNEQQQEQKFNTWQKQRPVPQPHQAANPQANPAPASSPKK